MQSEEARPLRGRSRSPLSLALGVGCSFVAIAGMLRIPPGLFEGPLPAIAVLMVILFAALKAPSSLAVFAAALAVFSAAAFAVVPLFASDPMSFLLSLDAVSADRVHEVARWVWAASAYAAALALAVDGWRG